MQLLIVKSKSINIKLKTHFLNFFLQNQNLFSHSTAPYQISLRWLLRSDFVSAKTKANYKRFPFHSFPSKTISTFRHFFFPFFSFSKSKDNSEQNLWLFPFFNCNRVSYFKNKIFPKKYVLVHFLTFLFHLFNNHVTCQRIALTWDRCRAAYDGRI